MGSIRIGILWEHKVVRSKQGPVSQSVEHFLKNSSPTAALCTDLNSVAESVGKNHKTQ